MLSLEVTVLAVLVGLYLFDCVILLDRGQALLERIGGLWRLAFGNRYYLIRAKPVALLNPLTPYRPTLKTLPLLGQDRAGALRPSHALRDLLPLPLLAAIQLGLVLVAVPVTMLHSSGWTFLTTLAVSYVNALAMLVIAFVAYRAAGLSRRPLWQLAFNCMVCLPLSVNLYRRASMELPLAYDAARCLRLVPETTRGRTREVLLGHIEDTLQEVDEGSPRFVALTSLQRGLNTEVGHG
jgi:hypothetical protein